MSTGQTPSLSSRTLAFLDTETVTLDPAPNTIWEVGLIIRPPGSSREADTEWMFQFHPNMGLSHPDSLRISGYGSRFCVPDGTGALVWVPSQADPVEQSREQALIALIRMLHGATVVGAVPDFDTTRLSLTARDTRVLYGHDPWHYHLVDVENLVAGLFGIQPPWKSDDLYVRAGVDPTRYDRHTALGDSRLNRDVYDRVMGTPRLQRSLATLEIRS